MQLAKMSTSGVSICSQKWETHFINDFHLEANSITILICPDLYCKRISQQIFAWDLDNIQIQTAKFYCDYFLFIASKHPL